MSLKNTQDIIDLEAAATLPALFQERVRRTPDAIAYRHFDTQSGQWLALRWRDCALQVASIQSGLLQAGLVRGDRVAIMLRNCPAWVCFEQAALGLGLVVVPLYPNDRAENVAYILQDAQVKALLVAGESSLRQLASIEAQLQGLVALLTVEPCAMQAVYPRLVCLADWEGRESANIQCPVIDSHGLATIVYTSGTTGRPKGVMLSHYNILYNISCALRIFSVYREDVFLSFLPLSHMLERTVGYLIPMVCGSSVAYARSVQDLAADLVTQRPTILISVPRIYERVYNKLQLQLAEKSPLARRLFLHTVDVGWRRFRKQGAGGWQWPLLRLLVARKVLDKLGGRLRLAICGGAPLSHEVARTFIGLDLNLIQGYGLTETSPMVCGNHPDDNDPASVGMPLPGIEISTGADNELLTRSPSVMLGYWQNEAATREMIDGQGWLHTGDQVRIEHNRIYITGRLKEIIVMSNGEKVSPVDMELAITMDTLFEQALIVGEGRPYLAAIVVPEAEIWKRVAALQGFDGDDPEIFQSPRVQRYLLGRIRDALRAFPGYAKVRTILIRATPWTIEDGSLTPTLKLRRAYIVDQLQDSIDALYH